MPYIPDGTIMDLTDPAPRHQSWWGRLRGRSAGPEPPLITSVRAFGWLSARHPFPTGPTPAGVLEVLEEAQRDRIWVTRGFHVSPFAPPGFDLGAPGLEPSARFVSDASLLVVDDDGAPWVAPSLVVHYVTDAGYLPPFTPHLSPAEWVDDIRQRVAEVSKNW